MQNQKKNTTTIDEILNVCSLLLYTCCYTHKERQVLILQRATNHLLWSYPGYQVNSGQNRNRKAQCQVEMAQKEEGERQNNHVT